MPLTVKPGDVITNAKLVEIFGCAPQGGMRKCKATNSLVLIADHTGRNPFIDREENGVIYYVGMGKSGDQDLDYGQNATLTYSRTRTLNIYYFDVYDIGNFTFRGEVYLSADPFQENQLGEDGLERKVWIFPLKIKGQK